MKISTRGRYGLRALVELAENNGQALLLKEIAERQDISMKYLGRIISNLKSAGLVSRCSDGYVLASAPEDISCREIINVLEGSLAPTECVDNPEICERVADCSVIGVWQRLKESWEEELENLTLADLAREQNLEDESKIQEDD